MIMSHLLRKSLLTLHVICSVSALGAIAAFLFLAIAGLSTEQQALSRAAYIFMQIIAQQLILPLLVASIVSGIVQSVGTTWGLFRHYWVVFKLALTGMALIVFLLQSDIINSLATAARQNAISDPAIDATKLRPIIHSSLGLVVMLVPVALSIFKPRGMTRYGWNRQLR
jgi:uncharacterized membrane protein